MAQSSSPDATPDEEPQSDSSANTWLLIGIAIAIVLGGLVGGFFPEVALNFKILGDMFLNALKMIVVPLIIFSLIVGVTGLGDLRKLGSLGWRTLAYYAATTAIAVAIGILLVNIIQPGSGVASGEEFPDAAYSLSGDNNLTVQLDDQEWDTARLDEDYSVVLEDQNLTGTVASVEEGAVTVASWDYAEVPEGVFYIDTADGKEVPVRQDGDQILAAEPEIKDAGAGMKATLMTSSDVSSKEGQDIWSTLATVVVGDPETDRQGLIPSNIFQAMVNVDILPLIFFSVLLAVALSLLGEAGRPAIRGIEALNDAVMKLVQWIVMLAPIGIFGIIAARVGDAGGFAGFLPELAAVGKYTLTVLLGLGLHGFVVLPLLLWFLGKRNPIQYFRGMSLPLMNAFSTASSSATLPLSLRAVTTENKVSPRTSNFVLPLGATVNMDGTALYEAVAAMFIAQVYGVTLTPGQQVVIFLTATLAAIGAAGIPEAGLVMLVIVLQAVGLPIEGVGLLLTVDWLLDRFRTTVNVWGDSVGAGILDTMENGPPEASSSSERKPVAVPM